MGGMPEKYCKDNILAVTLKKSDMVDVKVVTGSKECPMTMAWRTVPSKL